MSGKLRRAALWDSRPPQHVPDSGLVKWAEQEHLEALGAYLALAAIVLAPQCFGPPTK